MVSRIFLALVYIPFRSPLMILYLQFLYNMWMLTTFYNSKIYLTYLTYGGCKVRESIAVRHKHLFVISPLISLTHSRPVSFLRVSTNVILDPPCLLCPCFGSHRTSLCPTSSGCLSRCPASLILLCWILVVTRCNWS